MTLPVGVTTKTVQVLVPLDSLGNPAKAYTGTIRTDRPIVWAATGEPVWPVDAQLPEPVNGVVTFEAPSVDQVGFVDHNGVAVTNWSYKVFITGTWAVTRRSTYKQFQVFDATAEPFDLTVLPDDFPIEPVTPGDPYVTSVGGSSGTVTGAQLATAVGERITAGDTGIMDPLNASFAAATLDGGGA